MSTSVFSPSLAILISTFFWGTLWFPLRRLDEAGLGQAWATTLGFALPLAALVPFAVRRRHSILAAGWPLVRAGLLSAACVALYSEGLLRGTVARVILLFYLTPVWSTLVSRIYLGEGISLGRMATIALGLSGLWVVLNVDGVPLPGSEGEWMGLASGLLWACAMLALYRVPAQASDFDKLFAVFVFLAPVYVLLSAVAGDAVWTLPSLHLLPRAADWLVVLGLVWPVVLWLTIFGASRIDPGRVAVLLMLEVVIGVGSAAWLAGEPFGPRELVGALLIVGSCGSEYFAVGARRVSAAERV